MQDWRKPGWIQVEDENLKVGRWLNASGKPAVIEVESNTTVYDWVYAWGMFVVSQRLKLLNERFKVHAEYLAVQIIQNGNYVPTSYYCCNLLDAVDCFDFDYGKCTFWPSGDIRGIEVFRIDESKAAPYHLFRLGHGYDSVVLVSEELANEIKNVGLTGMEFMTIESWPEMA